jgi:phosphatidylglycerophosphate synthase
VASLGTVDSHLLLALNWFGDSLDGTLARLRKQQRPRYGFYVDHMLDSFGSFFLMGGLALSGYVNPWIAAGMLVTFLLLSIEVYLATYTLASFRLSYGKLGPTEIRLALIAGNLALYFRGAHVLGGRFLLFDVGGLIGIVAMGIMLIVSAVAHTRQLYREEPRP